MNNYPNQDNNNYQNQDNRQANDQYRDYRNQNAGQQAYEQGAGQQYSQNAGQYSQQNAQQNYNQAPNQNPYQQGVPQRPKKQSDFQVQGIVNETISWVKAFFSSDYTASIALAKKSDNQFGWALLFLAYFLLNPLVSLLSGLFSGLFIDFVAGLLSFFTAFFVSILVFALQSGVLLLSQVIFKEFNSKRWFEAFNASAVCLIPRIIALPVVLILRAVPFGIFYELSNTITIAANIATYGLLLSFMVHNKDKKSAKWIITGLIALYVLLVGFGMRIH